MEYKKIIIRAEESIGDSYKLSGTAVIWAENNRMRCVTAARCFRKDIPSVRDYSAVVVDLLQCESVAEHAVSMIAYYLRQGKTITEVIYQ